MTPPPEDPPAPLTAEQLRSRLLGENLPSPEERIRRRNMKIAGLRERSGLSMEDLAKAMGFKGSSSIQRYLSPSYDKGFRPEIASRFKAALHGRGNPPITSTDLWVFDSWPETPDGKLVDRALVSAESYKAGGSYADIHEKLAELGVVHTEADSIASYMAALGRIKAVGGGNPNDRVAGLPLAEGNVLLRIPKQLSAESAQTLRDWFDHLLNLAQRENLRQDDAV